jgi:hypothetical protein
MAAVDKAMAEDILERLERVELTAVADDISRLLADVGRGDAKPMEWHRFPTARTLAADLWSASGSQRSPADMDSWLSCAINSTAGRIAMFWVNAVAVDWRAAGDNWTGLPSETRAQLEVMLRYDDDTRRDLAEVVLSSQILLIFGADRAWSETHILPLLDWADPKRAQRTWDGYLIWGRWNDQLLSTGLLEGYLGAADHVDEFSDEPRERLYAHLAAVATLSEVHPLSWVHRFTVAVDVADRVEWMNQVAWMLKELPGDAVERQWQRWMRQYWQDRLNSVPAQLTADEATALAAWAAYLTESIADGVKLATARPAGFSEHTQVLSDLDDYRLRRAPAELASLIAHLMRGTLVPFWHCHELARIVPELLDGAARADINEILEQALRLGCGDAARW